MGRDCAWRSAGSTSLRPLRRIGKNLGDHLLAVVRVGTALDAFSLIPGNAGAAIGAVGVARNNATIFSLTTSNATAGQLYWGPPSSDFSTSISSGFDGACPIRRQALSWFRDTNRCDTVRMVLPSLLILRSARCGRSRTSKCAHPRVVLAPPLSSAPRRGPAGGRWRIHSRPRVRSGLPPSKVHAIQVKSPTYTGRASLDGLLRGYEVTGPCHPYQEPWRSSAACRACRAFGRVASHDTPRY
jgi:hypothetical protein